MATLQWSLICRDVVVDKNTNNISYRDAIEELSIGNFPSPLPSMFLIATLWRRDDIGVSEVFEIRVAVYDEEGNELGLSDSSTVDLQDHSRFRSQIPNPHV